MVVNSLYSTGLQGIQRGMQGLNSNAESIAKIGMEDGPNDLGDVAKEIVGLKENEMQVKASTKVLQSADRVLGSLLDIHA